VVNQTRILPEHFNSMRDCLENEDIAVTLSSNESESPPAKIIDANELSFGKNIESKKYCGLLFI